MSSTGLDVFDSALQKANLWLKEVEGEIHLDSRPKAYTTMRSVLHALRDCLPVQESAKLTSQLPMFIVGVYYEGWKPHPKPVRMTRADFFRRIQDSMRNQLGLDPALCTRAMIRVLR